MSWVELVRERAVPVGPVVPLEARTVLVVIAVALAVIVVGPLWRVLRIGVTLVHELGHALIGLAVGRKFSGFVLRGDMSGHAVTSGPPRGLGRVLSTWSGYPAPAVVGALMVWAAVRGWSAPVITAALLVLVVSLVRVRSFLTAVVMVAVLAATGALWWWRDDALQEQVLIAVGLVLVIGAWRHLGAVLRDGSRGSDPAVLASLTHVPKALWNLSFVLVCAAATWLVFSELAGFVR
ncbi:MAG: M50 family metallopeptidase [Actinomycetales bacterium]|nr:M50 family metallopeptidase [Actinomycetales bacterium]